MNTRDSVDFCVEDITSRYDAVDPVVEGVVGRLAAISKHVSRTFEETVQRHGLNLGEYRLLARLSTRSVDHQLSIGELGRILMLSSGAMTNRLDRLEEDGLVRRLRDPNDRRGVLVELTEAGQRRIDAAVSDEAVREIEVFEALNQRELASLNTLLRKVLVSLESAASAAAV